MRGGHGDSALAICRWNHSAFAAFVRTVEASGVPEIDVYRFDRDPPHGTVSALAPWMIDELQGFLARGPGAAGTTDVHLKSDDNSADRMDHSRRESTGTVRFYSG